jgi:hypothetical protein
MNTQAMATALKNCIEKSGDGLAILDASNKRKLSTLLSDFLPGHQNKEERERMRALLDVQNWSLVFEAHEKPEDQKQEVVESLYDHLVATLKWPDIYAYEVLQCYTNALGWSVSTKRYEIQTALALFNAGDYENTYKIISKLAEDKVPRAINFLGTMYQHGQHVEQDIEKSVILFREAGDLGEPRGYCNLADHIVNNRPMDKMKFDDGTDYEYQVPCSDAEQEEVRNLIRKAAAIPGT